MKRMMLALAVGAMSLPAPGFAGDAVVKNIRNASGQIIFVQLRSDLPVRHAIDEFREFSGSERPQPILERALEGMGVGGVVPGILGFAQRRSDARIFQVQPELRAMEMHGKSLARRNPQDPNPAAFGWSMHRRVDARALLDNLDGYAERMLPDEGPDALFDHAIEVHAAPPISGGDVTPDNVVDEAGPVGIAGRFVRKPAGAFLMGSPDIREEWQHPVTLTKDYRIQAAKVIWAQVLAFLPELGAYLDQCRYAWKVSNMLDHPATISRYYAMKFAERLSAATGVYFRLPTEAQWEYAARADMPAEFVRPSGNDESDVDLYAWHYDNAEKRPHPVAEKRGIGGLYDMLGNVSEWVKDGYADYPKELAADPEVDADSTDEGVVRGGSWMSKAWELRSARRFAPKVVSRDDHIAHVGFRLVMTDPKIPF